MGFHWFSNALDTANGIPDNKRNWAVAGCRHDVLLGIPWNKKFNPRVDCEDTSVSISGDFLLSDEGQKIKQEPFLDMRYRCQ